MHVIIITITIIRIIIIIIIIIVNNNNKRLCNFITPTFKLCLVIFVTFIPNSESFYITSPNIRRLFYVLFAFF